MLCDQTLPPATSFGTKTGQSRWRTIRGIDCAYFDAIVTGQKGNARYARGKSNRSYTRYTDLTVEEEDGDGYLHWGREPIVHSL